MRPRLRCTARQIVDIVGKMKGSDFSKSEFLFKFSELMLEEHGMREEERDAFYTLFFSGARFADLANDQGDMTQDLEPLRLGDLEVDFELKI